MKVILIQDVPKVGKKHDVKTVADGYALHALLPSGKAITATSAALKRVEKLRAEEEAQKKVIEDLVSKEVEKINGEEVTITLPANKEGHLFAALHEGEIATALARKFNAAIEAKHIVIDGPIKSVGTHRVHIKIGDKKGAFSVTVAGEEAK